MAKATTETTNPNMAIWDKVSVTDPDYAKDADIGGRKITAIDSYYQIKRATEIFGPFGMGWGYNADMQIVTTCTPPLTVIAMRLWYVPPGENPKDVQNRVIMGPVIASNKLSSNNGRVDEECFKKATTDALTKSLSLLGFSADVFMGAYDDQKYVKQLKEANEKKRAESAPLHADVQKVYDELADVKDVDAFKAWGMKIAPLIAAYCTLAQSDFIRLKAKMKKAEISPEEPAAAEERLQDAAA